MIDPYVCIGTPYRPRLLIIVVYGIFLNEITAVKKGLLCQPTLAGDQDGEGGRGRGVAVGVGSTGTERDNS